MVQGRDALMELDCFILECLSKGVSTCPGITHEWMDYSGMKYTEPMYNKCLTKINRHMKQLEKYGLVRYTGRTVSASDKSKIWETVI